VRPTNCDKARELFKKYFKRELSEEEDEAVIQHLSTCQKCMDVYSKLAREDMKTFLIRELGPPPPSPFD